MANTGKNIYILMSDNLSEETERQMQEDTLEQLYGEDYVYIVCEDDGAFIVNEEGSSVLIQEYF